MDNMDHAQDAQPQSKESSQSSGFGDIDYESFFKKVDDLVEEKGAIEKRFVSPEAKRPFSSLDCGGSPVWKAPRRSLFEGSGSDRSSTGVFGHKSGR
jgi:hypothetical protein